MATTDAAKPFPGPRDGPVFSHCFDEVVATSWLVPTAGAQPGTDGVLIAPHGANENATRDSNQDDQESAQGAASSSGSIACDGGGALRSCLDNRPASIRSDPRNCVI